MTCFPKNHILVFFLALILCLGCRLSSEDAKESTAFTIRGKLQNATPDPIFLSTLQDNGFAIADTASINDEGRFQFEGKFTSPEIARISLSHENLLWLVIDAPEIEVQADAQNLQQSYEVKASEESLLLKDLMDAEQNHQRKVFDVEKRFMAAQHAGQSDSLLYYQEKYLKLITAVAEQRKDFVRRHPDSFVASYAAYAMIGEEEGEFLDSMLIAFNQSIPDSKYVRLLNENRAPSNRIAVGEIAPEVVLPQPDGTSFSSFSLKGNYVLLDFWASWCKPCREENPNVARLYKRYHKRGFEILGISLDESKDRWIEAIETDKLPWHHVSDHKGLNSTAIQLYNIEAIPMTVLLDKEGRIIELNLRGRALEEKLEELFLDDSL
ncbi:MAG: TlpA disulfide reductase family protein [Cyclobacteriaceae bacterium]